MEEQLEQASKLIKEANIFILHIGAGFSADSGLPVYADIANMPVYKEMGLNYSDICKPQWLFTDPEIFYGFAGKCLNDYRNTEPHEGYQIIKKWKKNFFSSNSEKSSNYFPNQFNEYMAKKDVKDVTNNPFLIVSSNVDGHPQKVGFLDNEIIEIHGSMEKWQCSRANFSCTKEIWPLPRNFSFDVDFESMRAKNSPVSQFELSEDKIEKSCKTNHPVCFNCGELARPAVLMFSDGGWVNPEPETKFGWRKAVKELLSKDMDKKLLVLEIGCGKRVPSMRMQSESKNVLTIF